jgi:hypothetical protein
MRTSTIKHRHSFDTWASALILESGMLKELLNELGCSFRGCIGEGENLRAPCPVHGGDDRTACSVGCNVNPVNIYWRCWTRRCERTYKASITGLVQGILCRKTGQNVNVEMAIAYIEEFLGKKWHESVAALSKNHSRRGRHKSAKEGMLLNLPRGIVRRRLILPSPDMVERGFDPAILDEMDVGYSDRMHRTIFPIYNAAGTICVGFLSRTTKPECPSCRKHHNRVETCAQGKPRWCCMQGFPSGSFLFGYAKAHRSDYPIVFLVEGPTDAVAVAQAGFPAVASMGSNLTVEQSELLMQLGKQVAIVYDSDNAGRRGSESACLLLSKLKVPCRPFALPDGVKDPAAVSRRDLATWLPKCRLEFLSL